MNITLHTIYSCHLDLRHLSIKISCLVPSCSAIKEKVVSLVEEFLTYGHILCMMGSLSDLSVTLWPTQDQYVFIHDAVLESLTCGDTQIPASRLSGAIKKLKEKNRETGRTGFETQFHVCIPLILRNSWKYSHLMLWDANRGKWKESEPKVNDLSC